ncbi:MAG: hypothetical protein CMO55_08865 [Verrucomicrobiales bacterium]|nr:hypothetical protein [Verrucomicrobiales bacterium]
MKQCLPSLSILGILLAFPFGGVAGEKTIHAGGFSNVSWGESIEDASKKLPRFRVVPQGDDQRANGIPCDCVLMEEEENGESIILLFYREKFLAIERHFLSPEPPKGRSTHDVKAALEKEMVDALGISDEGDLVFSLSGFNQVGGISTLFLLHRGQVGAADKIYQREADEENEKIAKETAKRVLGL